MFIEKFTTKNGQEIQLKKFNILVGANNSGKSQTLRDIHSMITNRNARTTVLSNIHILKPSSFEDLVYRLEIKDSLTNVNQEIVRGIQSNMNGGDAIAFNKNHLREVFDASKDGNFIRDNIGKFKVAYLGAGSRLNVTVSKETQNLSTEPPSNLLQVLFGDPERKYEKQLNKVFKDTFSLEIILDYSSMKKLSLRVGKEFKDIPEDPRKAFPILSKFPKIEEQGDGFRSFTGVILSVLLSEGRAILLDEPEAFLHPSQARKLGYWLANHADAVQGQIIIATHNSNFLNGIIASNKETNIIRLNRENDNTSYHVISEDTTKKIANNHILSSQRVLEAIFYSGVVVCESDADKAIYQSVADKIFKNQNLLFIHAHNKQTIKEVTPLFREAKIKIIALPDIDILDDGKDFRELLKSLTDDNIDALAAKREAIIKTIEKTPEKDLLAGLTKELNELAAQLNEGKHKFNGAKRAIDRIRKGYSQKSKWKIVKQLGVSGFKGEIQSKAKELLDELKGHGIFVVPVGTLESWFNIDKRKGGQFTIEALKVISDNNCPTALKEFVKELLVKMGEDSSQQ